MLSAEQSPYERSSAHDSSLLLTMIRLLQSILFFFSTVGRLGSNQAATTSNSDLPPALAGLNDGDAGRKEDDKERARRTKDKDDFPSHSHLDGTPSNDSGGAKGYS